MNEARPPIEAWLAAAGMPPLTRLSWLEIDVEALAHNLGVVRRAVGDGVEVNAVVKADGYGHGIEAAARAFAAAGAARLCVATLDEAILLRGAGIRTPILVLFRVPEDALAIAAAAGIELTVADESTVDELARLPQVGRTPADPGALTVHLEVDTGLSRAGLAPDRVGPVARRLGDMSGVRLAGIWTHLASSDNAAATAEQVAAYERALAGIAAAGVPMPSRHVAASGAIFARTAPAYEAVRPGLCLYGLLPEGLPIAPDAAAGAESLRPAMDLRARPLRVESVRAGTGVGYDSRWRADRPSVIATLPVGYSDGLPRSSWPGAQALVQGRRVPLVGTVAMDAILVDVTDVPGIDLGSEFSLLGRDGTESITAHELARLRNTISWEVVATMAQRLPRVYHAGPVLVGARTLTGEHRMTE
jgi:alanine racemase